MWSCLLLAVGNGQPDKSAPTRSAPNTVAPTIQLDATTETTTPIAAKTTTVHLRTLRWF